jgi:hypothetical protein
MKLFLCARCGQPLMFENTDCERCGRKLGYLPDERTLNAVGPVGPSWAPVNVPDKRYRFCANWELRGCNWMVLADGEATFCMACRHNGTIPDISDPGNHLRWQKIEASKRRLFYSLINLDLPLPVIASGDEEPLVFNFLADPSKEEGGRKVMTGHESGVITISLAEADDAVREKLRVSMGEPYRTLLGHFRHEIGHYYWDKLVRDGGHIKSCRAIFGDDREDYAAALKRHYAEGVPAPWRDSFVSAYATTHPWEDFAETFAHYLHIVDTLETAHAFGIRIRPEIVDDTALAGNVDFNSYQPQGIATLIKAWLPLTFAVNSINRSMGHPDLYPFVLSPVVMDKLGYINDLVHRRL